jgi:hypothetical protein
MAPPKSSGGDPSSSLGQAGAKNGAAGMAGYNTVAGQEMAGQEMAGQKMAELAGQEASRDKECLKWHTLNAIRSKRRRVHCQSCTADILILKKVRRSDSDTGSHWTRRQDFRLESENSAPKTRFGTRCMIRLCFSENSYGFCLAAPRRHLPWKLMPGFDPAVACMSAYCVGNPIVTTDKPHVVAVRRRGPQLHGRNVAVDPSSMNSRKRQLNELS